MGDSYGYGGSGGGGYMPDSHGSGGTPGGRVSLASSSVRPVTIRQILRAEQSPEDVTWKLDGTETSQVTFVAQIMRTQPGSANIHFELDDGTGFIEARQWLDEDQTPEMIEERFQTVKWGRVLGTIKSFSNKRHVAIARINPIDDMNEIIYSQLEALATHLTVTKGDANGPNLLSGPSSGTAVSGGSGLPSHYTGDTGGASAENDPYKDLPALQRQVVLWIKNNSTSDEGVSFMQVGQAFQNSGPAAVVLTAIDALQENGHIYNTTDDDHYAAA